MPAVEISIGQRVEGELVGDTAARYILNAADGKIVYIDAHDSCVAGLTWRLLQPDGAQGAGTDACVDLGRRVLDLAGDWTIEMRSDASVGGTFAFTVLEVPPTSEKAISLGAAETGEVTNVGEWRRFVLAAQAGQIVYLDAQGDCVAGLWWRLLRPDGGLAAFNDSCVDLGRRVLDASGDWAIEVYSDSTATGPFSFRLLGVPPPQVLSVAVGESVDGVVAAIGEIHSYRFVAAVGQIVYLDSQGECVDALWWRLLRPDGGLASFNGTCTDLGREVLDVGGEWRLEIYSDSVATGAYAFRLLGVPVPVESLIAVGQHISGQITEVGEWHRFRFAATTGQTLTFDGQGDCIADLWWRVLRPDGSLAAFNGTCSDLGPVTVDVGGDWFVEVYSDFLATGAYAFTIAPTP
jgi:hypothetical protein